MEINGNVTGNDGNDGNENDQKFPISTLLKKKNSWARKRKEFNILLKHSLLK